MSDCLAKGDSLNNYFIQTRASYGFILKHKPSIGYLLHHVPSVQIRVGKKANGSKLWEQLYRYPEYGFGYYYADLGDPQILGKVNALYFFLNSPFYRSQVTSLNYEFAAGISYLNKCFDYRNNYLNNAIGSHFNAYFNFNINLQIKILKRFEVSPVIGFTHYSNGSFKKPNLGLNIIDANLGLKYFFNSSSPNYINTPIPTFKRKNEINITYSAGIKETYPATGPKYFISTITANILRQLNLKRKVGFGIDIFYDESLYKEFVETKNTEIQGVIRQGAFLSHEFVLAKFAVIINLGVYCYSKTTPESSIYTRVGIKYHLTENIFANINLKAHAAKADFIEWGVGYRFIK